MWILAALLFSTIKEQPGATAGGGNALAVALEQLRLMVLVLGLLSLIATA